MKQKKKKIWPAKEIDEQRAFYRQILHDDTSFNWCRMLAYSGSLGKWDVAFLRSLNIDPFAKAFRREL